MSPDLVFAMAEAFVQSNLESAYKVFQTEPGTLPGANEQWCEMERAMILAQCWAAVSARDPSTELRDFLVGLSKQPVGRWPDVIVHEVLKAKNVTTALANLHESLADKGE